MSGLAWRRAARWRRAAAGRRRFVKLRNDERGALDLPRARARRGRHTERHDRLATIPANIEGHYDAVVSRTRFRDAPGGESHELHQIRRVDAKVARLRIAGRRRALSVAAVARVAAKGGHRSSSSDDAHTRSSSRFIVPRATARRAIRRSRTRPAGDGAPCHPSRKATLLLVVISSCERSSPLRARAGCGSGARQRSANSTNESAQSAPASWTSRAQSSRRRRAARATCRTANRSVRCRARRCAATSAARRRRRCRSTAP